MKVRIAKSQVRGAVCVPGSKSYTIRAALCASMAPGESIISGALESDDSSAVVECLRGFGATVAQDGDTVRVRGGTLRAPAGPLWCRESAATFRFLAALAGTIAGVTVLRGSPSLTRRPMEPLLDALKQLDVRTDFDPAAGTLVVYGRNQSEGHVSLRGDVSSQFLSALLLSGTRFEGGLRIDLSSPTVSERYVDMTRECMRRFGVQVQVMDGGASWQVPGGGYSPANYVVEGDWSSAAALLALGSMAGEIRVGQLSPNSLQADVGLLELLRTMGATMELNDDAVVVHRSTLQGCAFEVAGAIDLLPVACALGGAATGETVLTGIARARDKESDRVAAMADGLMRLGVLVEVESDRMVIHGGAAHGGEVSSAGDHRIAMAFGVLGSSVGDVIVEGAECVSKTYPGFWSTLQSLGVKVVLDE